MTVDHRMTELQAKLDERGIDWKQIGPCLLICGDCMEVLPLLEAGSVDAVVTDPPYGISRNNHGGMLETRPQIDNDDDQHVGEFVLKWAGQRPVAVFASPRKPFDGEWRNVICWDKGGAVAGGGDPGRCLKLSWEMIQVRNNGVIGGNRDCSVWRHVVTQSDFENHPNEKPLSLIERLLETLFYCDLMLVDPCMGSGTTGVACIRTGRQFIGIEIEPKYFETACRRIKRAWREKRSELPLERPTVKQQLEFDGP